MICPKCGIENPSDNKFCKDCGIPLTSAPQTPHKKVNKLDKIIAIFIIIAAFGALLFIFTGGYPLGKPSVHIDDIQGTPNLLLSSFQIKFHIYNSGNGKAEKIYAGIGLEDAATGKTINSKSVYVGNLNPGESRIVTGTIPYSGNYQNLKYYATVKPY